MIPFGLYYEPRVGDPVRDGVSEVARAEAEAHVGELFGAVRRMVVQARRSG